MEKIKLIQGDMLEELKKFSDRTFDLIFADPPYNLSGDKHQTCKSGRMTACDKGEWDRIESIHEFNFQWVKECVRVLKDEGSIWISGTLHNHPSIGVILKRLDLWVINDVIWFKPNAPPLLQRNRLVPSVELIWWAAKSKKYYFDYQKARKMNDNKQMRNLWKIPARKHITPHPTEKPEPLLKRIITISSKPGDHVLDPFMGSGTTGAVAQKLNRHFTGIEIDEEYFQIAQRRLKTEKGLI